MLIVCVRACVLGEVLADLSIWLEIQFSGSVYYGCSKASLDLRLL